MTDIHWIGWVCIVLVLTAIIAGMIWTLIADALDLLGKNEKDPEDESSGS